MVASSKPDKVKLPVYNPIELARGWRILRQYLNLQIDLHKRTISATTVLSLAVLTPNLCNLALNLRRCSVTSVRVNSHPAAHRLLSPLDDPDLLHRVSPPSISTRVTDVQHSERLRREQAARCPELLVHLPVDVTADFIDDLKALSDAANLDKKPQDQTSPDAPPAVPVYDLPILHIEITYNVLDPNAGAIFYGDVSTPDDTRDPVYMLTDNRFGMARFWMPCIDSPNWCDRYLFDFDISVDSDVLVVASGQLVETVVFPHDQSSASSSDQQSMSKMYKYRSHTPAHAAEIVVAAGPFVPLPDPSLPTTVTHFCLPGHVHELVLTGPPLFARSLAFCRDYFGSDPPSSSFYQLFIPSLGLSRDTSITGAGGIIVHSSDLLHTERSIDEGFAAREAVMNSLVTAYFGRFLRPKASEDGWLISGLASHVANIGLGLVFGRNWYKFRIFDLMEELRNEPSCDLSNTKVDLLSGAELQSVQRRSHIILYMIERKIGPDVMKRALRDTVAEGKRIIVTHVRNIEKALSKTVFVDHIGDVEMKSTCLPSCRELSDLSGHPCGQNLPSGLVSTGFDEAVLGVGLGPFLKRIRAICGADVRSMVRLWASSTGIPRMQVGYQYNPRKHTIEFVVKQDMPTTRNIKCLSRPNLLFHGSISIRVMEADGAYDHSLDISEPIVAAEVPCHSRRTKTAKGSTPEAIIANSVTEASPLSWIRFDPENEWCKEVTFKQHESSWASLLEGERDVVGQMEAVQGLRGFVSEQSMRTLLSVLKDEQVYWRVRAEAASVLACSSEGLSELIAYFRSCYVDGDDGLTGHLRPNNFTSFANYFVKRAMLKAVSEARIKGSCTLAQPKGSVPIAASRFLCFVLAGHDNSGNDYDDDHYVVDLLNAISRLAVACIADEAHSAKEEGELSTTDTILRQLERFRSIERMIQRKSCVVAAGLVESLAFIERSKMIHQDRADKGSLSAAMRAGLYPVNRTLLKGFFDMSRRSCNFSSRLIAMSSLASTYGGLPEILLWLLTYVDRTSDGDDIISLRHELKFEEDTVGRGTLVAKVFSFSESPEFRYRILDALCTAASSREWHIPSSPLLLTLRRHSKEAMEFCERVHRLAVGDGDPRVRNSALQLTRLGWGAGVPVCLMTRREYADAKAKWRTGSMEAPKELGTVQSHWASLGGKDVTGAVGSSSSKGGKSAKGKSTKNGKTTKGQRKPSDTAVVKVSADLPPKPPKPKGVNIPVISLEDDVPVLSSEPKVRSRNTSGSSSIGGVLMGKPKGSDSPGRSRGGKSTVEGRKDGVKSENIPSISTWVAGKRGVQAKQENGKSEDVLWISKPPKGGKCGKNGKGTSGVGSDVSKVVDVDVVPTPKLSSLPLGRAKEKSGRNAVKEEKRLGVNGEQSVLDDSENGAVWRREEWYGNGGTSEEKSVKVKDVVGKAVVKVKREEVEIGGAGGAGRADDVRKEVNGVNERDEGVMPKGGYLWHPLDKEDGKLLLIAWEKAKEERKMLNSRVKGENGFEGSEEKKRKKKKKKRKREHGDEDEEERRKRKKKKKKKRRKESGEDREGEDGGSLSTVGTSQRGGDKMGEAEESKKIGKIQIKLPSIGTGHHL